MNITGKQVLVFGSGISGIGAAELLTKKGAVPIIYDSNAQINEAEILAKLTQTEGVRIVLGELKDEQLTEVCLAVLSPGVPLDIPEVQRIRAHEIPIWGELELAYQMGKGRVLAITGTNGKTTTTALTGRIMEDYYQEVYVVGNIGTPYTSVALDMTEQAVTVAEVSSFQLETTQEFAPQVSAILNITEDHLNRHHTMEEYIRVKELITAHQGAEEVCVLNYEDAVLRGFGKQLAERMRVVYFSSLRELEEGIFLRDGQIIWRRDGEELSVAKTAHLKLVGRHNHENVMAAVAMAYCAGVPMDSISRTICEFRAVPHRIEYVTEKHGVVYYNDSKGTNPDAAIKGIQAMERPTLLIGGGYDKQAEYEEWIRAFEGRVRYLVLIGQTREKIAQTAHHCGFYDTILADSLEEAVQICAEKAQPGDAVLLSPACASWGQFDNYEQRGDRFKEYVARL